MVIEIHHFESIHPCNLESDQKKQTNQSIEGFENVEQGGCGRTRKKAQEVLQRHLWRLI